MRDSEKSVLKHLLIINYYIWKRRKEQEMHLEFMIRNDSYGESGSI